MRTGVIVAGAIAVAAVTTASLMGAGVIGAQSRKAGVVTADSSQPAVRQVRTVPVAPPAPIVTTPPLEIAQQPAPAVETRPAPTAPPIETTGSIAPSTRTLIVNGARVALRESPDAKAKLIERMPAGQKLVELSRNGDWVRVRQSGSGVEGWVSSAFVGAKARN